METDRGWAWVVFAAALGSNYLNGALIYFVGVVHTGLLERFKESVTTTAWVGSLYTALLCLSVPVSSLVIGRYGCRVCSVLGGVVCSVGFVSSAFVTSISQLFFTYGTVAVLLTALGYALSATPSYIAVGFYFDKLRGLASGMTVAASALGILSGPVVMRTMMDVYSLSGAFMLVGAISLHYSLFGMFFRPTVYEIHAFKGKHLSEQNLSVNKQKADLSMAESTIDNEASTPFLEEPQKSVGEFSVTESFCPNIECKGRAQAYQNHSPVQRSEGSRISQVCDHVSDANSARKLCDKCFGDASHHGLSSGEVSVSIHAIKATNPERNSDSCGDTSPSDTTQKTFNGEPVREPLLDETAEEILHCLEQSESISQPSLGSALSENAAIKATSLPHNASDLKLEDSGNLVLSSVLESDSSIKMVASKLGRGSIWSELLLVLRNKGFLCYCSGLFLSSLSQMGVPLHLPEYAQSYGTSPQDAAALFVAIGVGSLVSRICTGLATVDPAVNPLVLNLGMRGLCGMATATFPLYANTHIGQKIYSAVFGLYSGGQFAIINVLIVHFLGVSLLNAGFCLLNLSIGIGYLVGPPLAALIIDNGGTYEHSFYFLGLTMLLGSCLDMVAGSFGSHSDDSQRSQEDTNRNV